MGKTMPKMVVFYGKIDFLEVATYFLVGKRELLLFCSKDFFGK